MLLHSDATTVSWICNALSCIHVTLEDLDDASLDLSAEALETRDLVDLEGKEVELHLHLLRLP